MDNLPAEILLQIFKHLNFEELLSFKQSNRYFYFFINKYKDEFPPKRFEELTFTFGTDNILKFEKKDLILSDNLKKKWQHVVDEQIPINLTLGNFACYEYVALHFDLEVKGLRKKNFYFKLPLFPQTIEELVTIRYWLLKVLRSVFDVIYFNEFIINPEIIKLLFDNHEITKLKFDCQEAIIFFNKKNAGGWKFIFDSLVISEQLQINFTSRQIKEEENIILFNFLSNSGIPKVNFVDISRPTTLYNLIINHIETSKDLSKMVAKIEFNCKSEYCTRSELLVKGVEIRRNNDRFLGFKFYKITNINDSKMVFLILWKFNIVDRNLIHCIEINRLYRN